MPVSVYAKRATNRQTPHWKASDAGHDGWSIVKEVYATLYQTTPRPRRTLLKKPTAETGVKGSS